MLIRRISSSSLLALALLAAAPAGAKCWAPTWQRVTDEAMGVSAEFAADTYRSHGDLVDFTSVTLNERSRGGTEIAGPCSDFRLWAVDFGGRQVSDAAGLLAAEQKRMLSYGEASLLGSRATTIDGHPALDFTYRSVTPYFGTTNTHKVRLISRGSRLYGMESSWDGKGSEPADSRRRFASVRFLATASFDMLRSEGMLSMTISQYYLSKPYPKRVYLSPALRRIADPKRDAERQLVEAYGHVYDLDFNRIENGHRVFRATHQRGVVDWYVKDDGKQINALTWKKVS